MYWLLSGDQVASNCTDRAEDPLSTALVVTPIGSEHAVERDAVTGVLPAVPRVLVRMSG